MSIIRGLSFGVFYGLEVFNFLFLLFVAKTRGFNQEAWEKKNVAAATIKFFRMKEMRSGSLANSNEIALFLVPENVMLVHTDVKL